jgi:hypothetical protein
LLGILSTTYYVDSRHEEETTHADAAGTRGHEIGLANPATPEEAQRLAGLKGAKVELEMLDRQLAVKQAEEKRLRGVMANYQARVEATAGRESEMTTLLREYETSRKNYQNLLSKQSDSKVHLRNQEWRVVATVGRCLHRAALHGRVGVRHTPGSPVGG